MRIKLILLLFLCGSLCYGQNLYVSPLNVTNIITPSSVCGLYLPYVAADSTGQAITIWVHNSGGWQVGWNDAISKWQIFPYNWTSALGYWQMAITPVGTYTAVNATHYNPYNGSTGLLSVAIQQNTSDLLAPSMVTNLEEIASNTLAVVTNQATINSQTVDLMALQVQARDSLNNIDEYTYGNNGYLASVVARTEDLVTLGTTNKFQFSEMVSGLDYIRSVSKVGFSDYDQDSDGESSQAEILYTMAARTVDSTAGRSYTEWLRDIQNILADGTIDVDIGMTNISVLGEVTVDGIDDLEYAVDSLNNDINSNHNDTMYGSSLTNGTLTNQPTYSNQSDHDNVVSAIGEVDYEVDEIITKNETVYGYTNGLASIMSLTMPTIGKTSMLDLMVPWSGLTFTMMSDAYYEFDMADYPMILEIRKFMLWIIVIMFFFMSINVVRSAVS